MLFSSSDVNEIIKSLSIIEIEKDDKLGIIVISVCRGLENHFKNHLLDCYCEEETDQAIINYFVKKLTKKYLKYMPEHIKNKIMANSL